MFCYIYIYDMILITWFLKSNINYTGWFSR